MALDVKGSVNSRVMCPGNFQVEPWGHESSDILQARAGRTASGMFRRGEPDQGGRVKRDLPAAADILDQNKLCNCQALAEVSLGLDS